MNILITGAGGAIGKHLSAYFSRVHTVFRIFKEGSTDNNRNFSFDLTQPHQIAEFISRNRLRNNKIDVIIHGASIMPTPDNRTDFQIYYNNIHIIESLCYMARQLNPRQLINLSSIGVYPQVTGIYDENSRIKPSANFECLYGLSKFCSEELFDFFFKGSNTRVINLRLPQIIGPEMRVGRYSQMLKELREKNSITLAARGQRESNFLFVEKLSEYIALIMENEEISGTFNLGEKNITYYELASAMIAQYGNPDSRILLKEEGDPDKIVININKIKKQLKLI